MSKTPTKTVNDLRPTQDAAWSFAAGAAALLTGIALRQILQQGWERTREEEAPLNPAAPDVSWGEALSWATLTGVVVAVGRVLVRRGVAELWRRDKAPAERWETERAL